MTAAALALSDHYRFDPDPPAGVNTAEQARATALLLRGARRLHDLASDGVLAQPWPVGQAGSVRARYVANCLRELDTFLSGLLDAVTPPYRDQPRRHRSAARLGWRVHIPGSAITKDDIERLHALDRSRACMWHCHGLVRRDDRPQAVWMTASWSTPKSARLRRYRPGEWMKPDGYELTDVATFYRDLTHRITHG